MILLRQADFGQGVGRFSLPNFWLKYLSTIAEIFDSFYGEQVNEGYYPHFNEVSLRNAILGAVPELAALTAHVQTLMAEGYCGLWIQQLNIQGFPPKIRHQFLYALSLALGYPTPTDPRQGKLLWDVKSRSLPEGHFATFSEHSERAELHTDTQYYPYPEELFILYSLRAARCGGGRSLLYSAQQLKAQLLNSAMGREAFEILSTFAYPFRVPTVFTASGKVGAVETISAPIFSHQPLIRFRLDTIEKGFQSRPDLDCPEARFGLHVLLGLLEHADHLLDFLMADDQLLICNNHTALHGRTCFQDPQRHLIRVRISAQPLAAKQVALAK
jgi:alpha-ketoglutarate-dependent taurine dioxygenase